MCKIQFTRIQVLTMHKAQGWELVGKGVGQRRKGLGLYGYI